MYRSIRACSSVRLERSAHNRAVTGSNPVRPIELFLIVLSKSYFSTLFGSFIALLIFHSLTNFITILGICIFKLKAATVIQTLENNMQKIL